MKKVKKPSFVLQEIEKVDFTYLDFLGPSSAKRGRKSNPADSLKPVVSAKKAAVKNPSFELQDLDEANRDYELFLLPSKRVKLKDSKLDESSKNDSKLDESNKKAAAKKPIGPIAKKVLESCKLTIKQKPTCETLNWPNHIFSMRLSYHPRKSSLKI